MKKAKDVPAIAAALEAHARWLRGRGGACADFRYADLSGLDFAGCDLRFADLRSANLEGADFSKANTIGARWTKPPEPRGGLFPAPRIRSLAEVWR
jgi:hypothetical protein